MTTNAPDNTPPEQPHRKFWHKYGKTFLIAFVFTVLVDVGARVFDLQGVVNGLESFEQSVEYGLSSVNIVTIFGNGKERLLNDRYHWRAWGLNTPFNLSVECRKRTSFTPGGIAELCQVDSNVYPRPKEDAYWYLIDTKVNGEVDSNVYPRRAYEYVMGLPDAIIHALKCAWEGADICRLPQTLGASSLLEHVRSGGQPAKGAEPRSNWFGKILLFLIGFAAYAATSKDKGSSKAGTFVVLFIIGLLSAMLLCVIVLQLVKALGALGQGLLSLSSVTLGLFAFAPAGWLFERVLNTFKDVLSDHAKAYMHKKTFKEETGQAEQAEQTGATESGKKPQG